MPLEILPDAAAVARALADLFVDVGLAAQADRGSFHVALSGGNTPRAAYELLGAESMAEQLSWSDVFVYFGDERCVPPDDEQSNYRMTERAFLEFVPIPPANVHRIRGEIEPAAAAAEYAEVLRTDLGNPPCFDLVLLGLGPDGHTASLFPGTPPDTDNDALVRAAYSESQAMWRVTITPKVINAARTVAFAVEGVEKTAILATVLEGPRDPTKYPAQIVAPESGNLVWLVDELAAGMLKTK
ncbi:MAG: 6-phosphogluconolactonase [Candidatus Eremiobacteraeota bacterium]|nr:6-phosphogluconolactonase [Candidatus Eremiobacteraeota bacterium]